MKVKNGKQEQFDRWVELNAKDGYSKCTVDFAVAWADDMEARLADGETVAGCYQASSSAVDGRFGITGFMYDCAVSALSEFWENGDDLRKAHNREYIKDPAEADAATDRGGVVNPAILTVSL